MNEINSIELLLHLFDAQYNRYNSFKEKININLALSSGIIAIISFLFPVFFDKIIFFCRMNSTDQLLNASHTAFLVIFIFVCIYFIGIYIFILIQSSISLTPIIVSLIDYEAIDLQTKGNSSAAYQTAVKDLKYTIEKNRESVNKLYDRLIVLQDCFLVFIALAIIVVLSVIFMSFV